MQQAHAAAVAEMQTRNATLVSELKEHHSSALEAGHAKLEAARKELETKLSEHSSQLEAAEGSHALEISQMQARRIECRVSMTIHLWCLSHPASGTPSWGTL